MLELLSRVAPEDLTAVLIIPTVALLVALGALASQVIRAIQQHREREIAASVVAEMLDHGIDPQQIVAVLTAMGLENAPQRPKPGRRKQENVAAAEQPVA